MTQVITGKTLKEHGWAQGKVLGLAKSAAQSMEAKGLAADAILAQLDQVRLAPQEYGNDPRLKDLAKALIKRALAEPKPDTLRDTALDYGIWGEEHIDREARGQMERALRLPVAVAGALMPDAHVGYGLPIGGVLATHEAVIPYAVGVDIACRMRLSLYEAPPSLLQQRAEQLQKALLQQTRFGMNAQYDQFDRSQHPVLDDDDAWEATRLLKSLRPKAMQQLGSSGTGNHFVEWGTFQLYDDDTQLGLKAGKYLALLSHSGSRGVGFKIANTYTQIARDMHPTLDKGLQYLAWLPLASEAGEEYWRSMELAGRFASANHQVIHQRVAKAAGLSETVVIENYHNFAWRETLADGTEAIVHRKGATPAGSGVLGIIPGSMGDAGYVVRGRGDATSLQSASHGAGRKLSRTAAINSITKTARDVYLRERGVTLLGGGLDESPQAYKDIEAIIAAQDDLVEVLGKFTPRIVRMADEPGDF
jgi:tRNA-splicing ligase RtcB (3'-phosphate/5'-hydroxy nucleic acid ligase)